MAKFVDIGALWRPKPDSSSKAALSGVVNVDGLEEAIRSAGNSKSIRVFIQVSKQSKSSRAPDYRLVAVFDDNERVGRDDRHRDSDSGRVRDERDYPARDGDGDRNRDCDRDRDRDRPRVDRPAQASVGGRDRPLQEQDDAPF